MTAFWDLKNKVYWCLLISIFIKIMLFWLETASVLFQFLLILFVTFHSDPFLMFFHFILCLTQRTPLFYLSIISFSYSFEELAQRLDWLFSLCWIPLWRSSKSSQLIVQTNALCTAELLQYPAKEIQVSAVVNTRNQTMCLARCLQSPHRPLEELCDHFRGCVRSQRASPLESLLHHVSDGYTHMFY